MYASPTKQNKLRYNFISHLYHRLEQSRWIKLKLSVKMYINKETKNVRTPLRLYTRVSTVVRRLRYIQYFVAKIVQICIMHKVFSKCLLLFFPVLSSRSSVSKRSQILGLRPQTCTTFSQHNIPALKTGKKSNSHLEKLFSRQIQTIIATKYYLPSVKYSQF